MNKELEAVESLEGGPLVPCPLAEKSNEHKDQLGNKSIDLNAAATRVSIQDRRDH